MTFNFVTRMCIIINVRYAKDRNVNCCKHDYLAITGQYQYQLHVIRYIAQMCEAIFCSNFVFVNEILKYCYYSLKETHREGLKDEKP